MNKTIRIICLTAFLVLPAVAADDTAPKPKTPKEFRIFLYVPNSTKPLEYTDVAKIIRSDLNHITFETTDGFVVVHHGAYTSIQPKDTFNAATH